MVNQRRRLAARRGVHRGRFGAVAAEPFAVALSGHAHPWDVLGDPDFPLRVREMGLRSVTLAAAYPATRAPTPLHPAHRVVEARHAALYRPVRDAVWAGRRLRPLGADWLAEADPFADAAAVLWRAGIDVTAWLVLTQVTSPDGVAGVVNCFGDRYPQALCPNQPHVREYASTLAAEAVRDVPLAGVLLEACGQPATTPPGRHRPSRPDAVRWLSVCCCTACAARWLDHGLDPALVRVQLRAAVDDRDRPPAPDVARAVLAGRHAGTDALRRQVCAAVREHAPGIPITLHAHPDPWATGRAPGLTATAASDVDIVLISAGLPVSEVDTTVHGYISVLGTGDPSAAVTTARRLVDAGVVGLGLHHLGRASRSRQRVLAEIVASYTR